MTKQTPAQLSNFKAFFLLSIYSAFVARNHTYFTALFNNMRTLKLKGRSTNAFFAAVNQMSAGPPSLRLLPNSVRCLNCAQLFDYHALGSNRNLGGAGEHLIDGSEKRICRLSLLLKGAVKVSFVNLYNEDVKDCH